jgi:hypothetical protein
VSAYLSSSILKKLRPFKPAKFAAIVDCQRLLLVLLVIGRRRERENSIVTLSSVLDIVDNEVCCCRIAILVVKFYSLFVSLNFVLLQQFDSIQSKDSVHTFREAYSDENVYESAASGSRSHAQLHEIRIF